MTTHELARKLLEGPDVMVTRNGYEGGTEEITLIEPVATLYLNVRDSPYYGPHSYDESVGILDEDRVEKTVQAVNIK